MSALNTKCPPQAVLSDFGLGKLDGAGAETVSQHLETCADCRERVAGLSGDSFVGRLRQAGDAAQGGAGREQTHLPGESRANAANSTDGSLVTEDVLRSPSQKDVRAERRVGLGVPPHEKDGLGSPTSVSVPPGLVDHPDYELIKQL